MAKTNNKRGADVAPITPTTPAITAAGKKSKNLHLLVDLEAFERFRTKCQENRMDLSEATELLWSIWVSGRISISTAVQVQIHEK